MGDATRMHNSQPFTQLNGYILDGFRVEGRRRIVFTQTTEFNVFHHNVEVIVVFMPAFEVHKLRKLETMLKLQSAKGIT